jgi:hypothetical protein
MPDSYNSSLLIVSDTIQQASYLKDWREFKDRLRKILPDQPGWSEVYASAGAEAQGWARLRSEQDADCAYGTSILSLYATRCG